MVDDVWSWNVWWWKSGCFPTYMNMLQSTIMVNYSVSIPCVFRIMILIAMHVWDLVPRQKKCESFHWVIMGSDEWQTYSSLPKNIWLLTFSDYDKVNCFTKGEKSVRNVCHPLHTEQWISSIENNVLLTFCENILYVYTKCRERNKRVNQHSHTLP